jgi:histidinol-phosphate aminotransferase
MGKQPRTRPEISLLKRYIPGKPIEEVAREQGLIRIVKLASNENPIGPSPKAVQALRGAIDNVHLYPDDGQFSLKKALSVYHQLDESHFVIGNGAVEIIRMIMEVFIESGDEVIAAVPSFAIYKQDVVQMGGKLVEIPLDETFHYDLKNMRNAVNSKTRMVIFCSPNNPTGTTIKKEAFEKFLQGLPSRVFIVLDEAYSDFVEENNGLNGIPYVLENYPLISLRTFSKAYGLAGIRVGYGITSSETAFYLNQVRVLFNVSSLAQTAAAAALADREHYQKSREIVWREKSFLYSEFRKLGIEYTETQSNFLLVKIKNDLDVFQSLLREGVIVRPGSQLSMPGWVRITIGKHEDNLILLHALEKVLQQCRI